MAAVGTVVLVVAVVLVGFAVMAAQFRRADELLERWARDQGFRIVYREYRWFCRGPFFWTTARGQVVFYVEVLEETGARLTGYVRCGGWFLGLLSDHVDWRLE